MKEMPDGSKKVERLKRKWLMARESARRKREAGSVEVDYECQVQRRLDEDF